MNSNPMRDAVEKAVDACDGAALRGLLRDGLDPGWQDADGRRLLHYAAAWGDDALAADLLQRGAAANVQDRDGDTPADYAFGFANKALGKKLLDAARPDTAPLPYACLADIRAAGGVAGVTQFPHLVRTGRIDDLLALAAGDARGFEAADFLAAPRGGDSALFYLCQRGELQKIMQVPLWVKRPDVFFEIWAQVPKPYRAGLDAESFRAALQRAGMQSKGLGGGRGGLARRPHFKPPAP